MKSAVKRIFAQNHIFPLSQWCNHAGFNNKSPICWRHRALQTRYTDADANADRIRTVHNVSHSSSMEGHKIRLNRGVHVLSCLCLFYFHMKSRNFSQQKTSSWYCFSFSRKISFDILCDIHERTDCPGGLVGCASDWLSGGCGLNPRRGRQHSFAETDHEIFSTVILSLLLI